MEWRPARWSVCLPLLISPCIVLPGWSRKKGHKMVVVWQWFHFGLRRLFSAQLTFCFVSYRTITTTCFPHEPRLANPLSFISPLVPEKNMWHRFFMHWMLYLSPNPQCHSIERSSKHWLQPVAWPLSFCIQNWTAQGRQVAAFMLAVQCQYLAYQYVSRVTCSVHSSREYLVIYAKMPALWRLPSVLWASETASGL